MSSQPPSSAPKDETVTACHIDIAIELDARRIAKRICWQADEDPENSKHDTKALLLASWDEERKQTLRLELWTETLRTDDMKRFYIDLLGGMSQGILRATGDAQMSKEIEALRKKLAEQHHAELKQGATTPPHSPEHPPPATAPDN